MFFCYTLFYFSEKYADSLFLYAILFFRIFISEITGEGFMEFFFAGPGDREGCPVHQNKQVSLHLCHIFQVYYITVVGISEIMHLQAGINIGETGIAVYGRLVFFLIQPNLTASFFREI